MLFRLCACGLDVNNTDFLQAQANAANVHSEDSPTCSNGKCIFSYFVLLLVCMNVIASFMFGYVCMTIKLEVWKFR